MTTMILGILALTCLCLFIGYRVGKEEAQHEQAREILVFSHADLQKIIAWEQRQELEQLEAMWEKEG